VANYDTDTTARENDAVQRTHLLPGLLVSYKACSEYSIHGKTDLAQVHVLHLTIRTYARYTDDV